jgi:hypothetical protein
MCTKHGMVLLAACAMLAGSSATFSAAHAQGFGFFLPPPMFAPPPPAPYYGPDIYEDEAEPYYDHGPRHYRPEPRRRPHYAPAPRRKRPAATVERRAPARKPQATALAVPPKASTPRVVTPKVEAPKAELSKAVQTGAIASGACGKAQSRVAEFGFRQITPQSCNGKTLSFRAVRDGKSFQIQVLADSGELTKVQRLK